MLMKAVDLFEWKMMPAFSKDHYLIKLTPEPYTNMTIFPTDIDMDRKTDEIVSFKYGIMENPNDLDVKNDPKFHEYLQTILEHLIEIKHGVSAIE